MIDKHQKYLNFLAIEANEQRSDSRCTLCALIVYKNMPIALGRNRMKSHPFQAKFGRNEHSIFLHAETDVLLKASKQLTNQQLSKSTLYICRVLNNGRHAISKPCPGCQKAIKEYNIGKVVWTTDNGYSTSEHEELNETDQIYEDRRASKKRKVNCLLVSAH